MDNYEQMGTSELRKLIRERGIGKGLALSGANKETCIRLLRGELAWADFEASGSAASFSASSGDSTCKQQAAAPAAGSEGAMAQIAVWLALPVVLVAWDEMRKGV